MPPPTLTLTLTLTDITLHFCMYVLGVECISPTRYCIVLYYTRLLQGDTDHSGALATRELAEASTRRVRVI